MDLACLRCIHLRLGAIWFTVDAALGLGCAAAVTFQAVRDKMCGSEIVGGSFQARAGKGPLLMLPW